MQGKVSPMPSRWCRARGREKRPVRRCGRFPPSSYRARRSARLSLLPPSCAGDNFAKRIMIVSSAGSGEQAPPTSLVVLAFPPFLLWPPPTLPPFLPAVCLVAVGRRGRQFCQAKHDGVIGGVGGNTPNVVGSVILPALLHPLLACRSLLLVRRNDRAGRLQDGGLPLRPAQHSPRLLGNTVRSYCYLRLSYEVIRSGCGDRLSMARWASFGWTPSLREASLMPPCLPRPPFDLKTGTDCPGFSSCPRCSVSSIQRASWSARCSGVSSASTPPASPPVRTARPAAQASRACAG